MVILEKPVSALSQFSKYKKKLHDPPILRVIMVRNINAVYITQGKI